MIYLKYASKINRGNSVYHVLIWNDRCKIVHIGTLDARRDLGPGSLPRYSRRGDFFTPPSIQLAGVDLLVSPPSAGRSSG
jgi:hypothetical protein